MKTSIKKLIVFFIILITIIAIQVSVNAVTVHETTTSNDGYDTLEKGTIIIGTTKFLPNTIITAKKAAMAGANDLKVFLAKGGKSSDYTGPEIYTYVATNDWYNVKEDGAVQSIAPVAALDIYFVENEPKTGIDSATGQEIEIPSIEEDVCTVTFMNGSSIYGEVQTIDKGKNVTKPEVDPSKEGYNFVGWYNNESEFDFSKAITEDTVITAEYKAITYKIAVASTANGTITTDPTPLAICGDIITITVTNDDGYTLVPNSLVVKDSKNNVITVSESNTFVMPADDVVIDASFVKLYTITKNVTGNGTVTITGTNTTVQDGIIYTVANDTITLAVAPDAGCIVKAGSFTVKDALNGDVTLSATNDSFTMPESNVTVSVEFVKSASTIDTENDSSITTNVNTFNQNVTAPSDAGITEATYNTTTNTATFTVNEAKKNSVTLESYGTTYVSLILDVLDGIKSISYDINGVAYNVDVSTITTHSVKVEAAKILLNMAGESIPSDEATLVSKASALKLADVIGKTANITADYDTDEVINYQLVFNSVSFETLKEEENDSAIQSTVTTFNSSVTNSDAITEMQFNGESNTVTFVVNEEKQSTAKVASYADTFLDIAEAIIDGAQTISYVANGTPYNVNVAGADDSTIQSEFAKAILRILGKDVSLAEAAALKLEDVVGISALVNIDYGNSAVIPYTIAFQN